MSSATERFNTFFTIGKTSLYHKICGLLRSVLADVLALGREVTVLVLRPYAVLAADIGVAAQHPLEPDSLGNVDVYRQVEKPAQLLALKKYSLDDNDTAPRGRKTLREVAVVFLVVKLCINGLTAQQPLDDAAEISVPPLKLVVALPLGIGRVVPYLALVDEVVDVQQYGAAAARAEPAAELFGYRALARAAEPVDADDADVLAAAKLADRSKELAFCVLMN